jgi:hypothetical protein
LLKIPRENLVKKANQRRRNRLTNKPISHIIMVCCKKACSLKLLVNHN